MMDNAVFIGIHINIPCFARQLQTAVSVFLPVDILTATNRKQSGIKFCVIGCIVVYLGQAFAIAECYFLAMLTTAHIECLPLSPPFSTNLFCNLFQSCITILAFIVNCDILCSFNGSDLEVGNITHTVIDTLHDHCNVFSWRCGQCEHWFILPIHSLKDKETLD